MKLVVGVCCLMFVNVIFGQSKKEMIAILNNRVDSLNQVVSAERSEEKLLNQLLFSLRKENQTLISESSALKMKLSDVKSKKDDLTEKLKSIEEKNAKLTADYDKQSSALKAAEQKIKMKEDSLVLLADELLKYKRAPKEKLVVKKVNTGSIKTVTIGTQVWMVSNLNISSFRNGVEIPEVQDRDAWYKAGDNKQPAWCYYENDPKNGVKYGKLYNWHAVVNSNGLCPQGWHVPSDKEWGTLESYLGENDGTKMKAKSGWRLSGDGNNLSGFTGLPGGYRGNYGDYDGIDIYGYWWSSTEDFADLAWVRFLASRVGYVGRTGNYEKYGLSVRCLRD